MFDNTSGAIDWLDQLIKYGFLNSAINTEDI